LKREVRALLQKAVDSLVLSVEIFNRPSDQGRSTATLIMLDHSFEMFMKAAIVHKGGAIREKRDKHTIGFDACVRKAISDVALKFLSEEQALTVQAVNGLRDAAQHHLVEVSENQLYMHAISSVTLFKDLLLEVFGQDLVNHLPNRVLPISTVPPLDLIPLFAEEIEEIKKLLAPGKRRLEEARVRLMPLEILDRTIGGYRGQPGTSELKVKCESIMAGKPFEQIFPNVASLDISAKGSGPSLQLRFTKKEGIPINTVPEGTPGAYPVGLKRVNELDFYNLNLTEIANKVGLTPPKALAVIQELGIMKDPDCFKQLKIGKMEIKRYSQKASQKMIVAMPGLDLDDVWERNRPRKKA